MEFKRGSKAQLTIFIIIAIAIVAVALILFFLWPTISGIFMSEQQASNLLASQAEPLRNAVLTCVEKTTKDAVLEMGLHSGFLDYSHLFTVDYAGDKVFVLYKDFSKNRINKFPSLEQIKQEFNGFLENGGYEEIDKCLNNFNSFKRQIDIEPGVRKIDLTIESDSIIVNVDWPIKLSKSTISKPVSQTINQKPVELLIPLGRVWKFSNDIINYEAQQIDFENVEDDYNWNHPERRLWIILNTARYPTSNQVIYMMETVPHRIGEEPFRFYFAVDRI